MDDAKIVEMYWERNEEAVSHTAKKYTSYCMQIARNILSSEPDCEECTNDTFLRAWESIPPHRPLSLATFLGKITRNLAIDRFRALSRDKRGGGEFALSLEELDECIPDLAPDGTPAEEGEISRSINAFLHRQPETVRRVFVCRYFYSESLSDIAQRFGMSESRVKSMLHRTRIHLKAHLDSDGIFL